MVSRTVQSNIQHLSDNCYRKVMAVDGRSGQSLRWLYDKCRMRKVNICTKVYDLCEIAAGMSTTLSNGSMRCTRRAQLVI